MPQKSGNEVREEKKRGKTCDKQYEYQKFFKLIPRCSQERSKKEASSLRGRGTTNQKAQEVPAVGDDLSFPQYNAIKSLR